jgi:hypothetical protein
VVTFSQVVDNLAYEAIEEEEAGGVEEATKADKVDEVDEGIKVDKADEAIEVDKADEAIEVDMESMADVEEAASLIRITENHLWGPPYWSGLRGVQMMESGAFSCHRNR